MLCSSLFRRQEWVTTARALTQPPLQLKERRLEGHDIAIPIHNDSGVFKLALFVSPDAAKNDTLQRVERLVLLGGGGRVGVVLFLSDEGANARMASLNAFQILLSMAFPDIPIFPISTPPADFISVLTSLQSHHSLPPPPPEPGRARALIPHLTGGSRPLSIATADKLAQMYDGLGQFCSEVLLGRGGREAVDRLVDGVGEADARRVVEFFASERVIEKYF